jgi:hypothetical protein
VSSWRGYNTAYERLLGIYNKINPKLDTIGSPAKVLEIARKTSGVHKNVNVV